MTKPVKRAIAGEAMRATTILPIPIQLRPTLPTETSTAPTRPPTSAWDELEGMPIFQVRRFQNIAPIRAAMMIFSLTKSGELTISPPIVFATPVETIAPRKFKIAAIAMA